MNSDHNKSSGDGAGKEVVIPGGTPIGEFSVANGQIILKGLEVQRVENGGVNFVIDHTKDATTAIVNAPKATLTEWYKLIGFDREHVFSKENISKASAATTLYLALLKEKISQEQPLNERQKHFLRIMHTYFDSINKTVELDNNPDVNPNILLGLFDCAIRALSGNDATTRQLVDEMRMNNQLSSIIEILHDFFTRLSCTLGQLWKVKQCKARDIRFLTTKGLQEIFSDTPEIGFPADTVQINDAIPALLDYSTACMICFGSIRSEMQIAVGMSSAVDPEKQTQFLKKLRRCITKGLREIDEAFGGTRAVNAYKEFTRKTYDPAFAEQEIVEINRQAQLGTASTERKNEQTEKEKNRVINLQIRELFSALGDACSRHKSHAIQGLSSVIYESIRPVLLEIEVEQYIAKVTWLIIRKINRSHYDDPKKIPGLVVTQLAETLITAYKLADAIHPEANRIPTQRLVDECKDTLYAVPMTYLEIILPNTLSYRSMVRIVMQFTHDANKNEIHKQMNEEGIRKALQLCAQILVKLDKENNSNDGECAFAATSGNWTLANEALDIFAREKAKVCGEGNGALVTVGTNSHGTELSTPEAIEATRLKQEILEIFINQVSTFCKHKSDVVRKIGESMENFIFQAATRIRVVDESPLLFFGTLMSLVVHSINRVKTTSDFPDAIYGGIIGAMNTAMGIIPMPIEGLRPVERKRYPLSLYKTNNAHRNAADLLDRVLLPNVPYELYVSMFCDSMIAMHRIIDANDDKKGEYTEELEHCLKTLLTLDRDNNKTTGEDCYRNLLGLSKLENIYNHVAHIDEVKRGLGFEASQPASVEVVDSIPTEVERCIPVEKVREICRRAYDQRREYAKKLAGDTAAVEYLNTKILNAETKINEFLNRIGERQFSTSDRKNLLNLIAIGSSLESKYEDVPISAMAIFDNQSPISCKYSPDRKLDVAYKSVLADESFSFDAYFAISRLVADDVVETSSILPQLIQIVDLLIPLESGLKSRIENAGTKKAREILRTGKKVLETTYMTLPENMDSVLWEKLCKIIHAIIDKIFNECIECGIIGENSPIEKEIKKSLKEMEGCFSAILYEKNHPDHEAKDEQSLACIVERACQLYFCLGDSVRAWAKKRPFLPEPILDFSEAEMLFMKILGEKMVNQMMHSRDEQIVANFLDHIYSKSDRRHRVNRPKLHVSGLLQINPNQLFRMTKEECAQMIDISFNDKILDKPVHGGIVNVDEYRLLRETRASLHRLRKEFFPNGIQLNSQFIFFTYLVLSINNNFCKEMPSEYSTFIQTISDRNTQSSDPQSVIAPTETVEFPSTYSNSDITFNAKGVDLTNINIFDNGEAIKAKARTVRNDAKKTFKNQAIVSVTDRIITNPVVDTCTDSQQLIALIGWAYEPLQTEHPEMHAFVIGEMTTWIQRLIDARVPAVEESEDEEGKENIDGKEGIEGKKEKDEKEKQEKEEIEEKDNPEEPEERTSPLYEAMEACGWPKGKEAAYLVALASERIDNICAGHLEKRDLQTISDEEIATLHAALDAARNRIVEAVRIGLSDETIPKTLEQLFTIVKTILGKDGVEQMILEEFCGEQVYMTDETMLLIDTPHSENEQAPMPNVLLTKREEIMRERATVRIRQETADAQERVRVARKNAPEVSAQAMLGVQGLQARIRFLTEKALDGDSSASEMLKQLQLTIEYANQIFPLDE